MVRILYLRITFFCLSQDILKIYNIHIQIVQLYINIWYINELGRFSNVAYSNNNSRARYYPPWTSLGSNCMRRQGVGTTITTSCARNLHNRIAENTSRERIPLAIHASSDCLGGAMSKNSCANAHYAAAHFDL